METMIVKYFFMAFAISILSGRLNAVRSFGYECHRRTCFAFLCREKQILPWKQRRPTRIHSISTSSLSSSDIQTLSEQLKNAYQLNETDGILAVAPSLFSSHVSYSPKDYITATVNASPQNNKVQIAGILNALLAACHVHYSSQAEMEQQAKGRRLAWDLFSAWQDWVHDSTSDDDDVVTMDMVSYCTAFTCLDTPIDMEEDEYDIKAEKLTSIHQSLEVLELARRFSYKQGNGMKKRRRNNSITSSPEIKFVDDHQKKALKQIYGPDFDILLETVDFLVVNKPSGMVCYHKHRTSEGKVHRRKKTKSTSSQSTSGLNTNPFHEDNDNIQEGTRDVSLEDALSALKMPLSELNPEALGIVHRLDRGTSGCIIIAKNDSTHAKLVTAFFSRNIAKSYLAIVSYQESCMQKRHGQDEIESFPSLFEGSTGTIDIKVQGKPALSEYTVLKIIREDLILLRVFTYTGRYHQVRQHCAQGLGRPILLDPEYNTVDHHHTLKFLSEKSHGQRFFLHCESLTIDCLQIQVKAPMPTWWNQFLS